MKELVKRQSGLRVFVCRRVLDATARTWHPTALNASSAGLSTERFLQLLMELKWFTLMPSEKLRIHMTRLDPKLIAITKKIKLLSK